MSPISSLRRANWVKVNGTRYQTPFAVVIGQSDKEEELLFGHVLNVLVYSKEVLFEFELLDVQYCKHYHAYALSIPPNSSSQKYLIKHKDLLHYHPYGLYHCHNITNNPLIQYTVLRCNICMWFIMSVLQRTVVNQQLLKSVVCILITYSYT